MDSQAVPDFGRTESIVIPFPGQPLDVSLDSPPDTATDNQRTTNGQNRTYTFKQAAALLAVNESTLRRRYWQAKIEPAFKHCPTPLREIVRYNRDNQPVHEFSDFGLSVLQAFLAAKSDGQEESFLLQARQQYPAPLLPETQAGHQPLDAEIVDPQPSGQLTLNQTAYEVAGSLINVNVGSLNITVQAANTSPIEAQTAQYRDLTNQAAAILNQGLTVRTEAKYNEAVAQIDHALAGMQANALLNIARQQADQQPVPGKSPVPDDSTTSG